MVYMATVISQCSTMDQALDYQARKCHTPGGSPAGWGAAAPPGGSGGGRVRETGQRSFGGCGGRRTAGGGGDGGIGNREWWR
uniref:Uncharacterized protein n=1 Tax=Arundo donax TaxID=35708 RepID=A0A0A9EWY6_ARUDO